MKVKKITPTILLLVMLLGLAMVIPSIAQAGKNHHRNGYGNAHYYDRHDRAYSDPRHHFKRNHRSKHSLKHQHRGYKRTYDHPHGYYKRQYPQPRYYGRNYSYSSYNYNYSPAPSYGYPSNVMLGINTGNARFMLRY